VEHVREKGGALGLFLNQGLIRLPEASDSRRGWWILVEDDDSDCEAAASKKDIRYSMPSGWTGIRLSLERV
jgi:hypothetical protein